MPKIQKIDYNKNFQKDVEICLKVLYNNFNKRWKFYAT